MNASRRRLRSIQQQLRAMEAVVTSPDPDWLTESAAEKFAAREEERLLKLSGLVAEQIAGRVAS